MTIITHDAVQGGAEWHRLRHAKVTASCIDRILSSGGNPKRPTFYELTDTAPDMVPRSKPQTAVLDALSGGPHTAAGLPTAAIKALVDKGFVTRAETPDDAPDIWDGPRFSAQRKDYMYKLLAEWASGEDQETFAGNHWTERGHELESEAADYYALQTGSEPLHVGFVENEALPGVGCSPDWLVENQAGWSHGCEVKCPSLAMHLRYLLEDGVPLQYQGQVQFSMWVTGLPRWDFLSYHPGMPPVLIEVEPHPLWTAALDELLPQFLADLEAAKQQLLALGVEPHPYRAPTRPGMAEPRDGPPDPFGENWQHTGDWTPREASE